MLSELIPRKMIFAEGLAAELCMMHHSDYDKKAFEKNETKINYIATISRS